jgi:hypothetical protein
MKCGMMVAILAQILHGPRARPIGLFLPLTSEYH